MVNGLDAGEFLDHPQNFLHVRRRQLLDRAFVEELHSPNFLERPVSIEVSLVFDVDFADIFEVRGARTPAPRSTLAGRRDCGHRHVLLSGRDAAIYASAVTISPTPYRLEQHAAMLTLEIPAGGSRAVELRVVPERDHVARARPVGQSRASFGDDTARARATAPRGFAQTAPARFDARVETLLENSGRFREASTRVRCDDALIRASSTRRRSTSIRCAWPEPSTIVAAGIPWFCCPFGRASSPATNPCCSIPISREPFRLAEFRAESSTRSPKRSLEKSSVSCALVRWLPRARCPIPPTTAPSTRLRCSWCSLHATLR